MQKLSAAFLLSAALFSGAAIAAESDLPYGHDSDPDACGAALCLLGTTRDGDCDKYITKYLSIYRTRHGKFSPSRTGLTSIIDAFAYNSDNSAGFSGPLRFSTGCQSSVEYFEFTS